MIKRGHLSKYTNDENMDRDNSLRNKKSSVKTIDVMKNGKESINQEEEEH